MKTYTSSKEVSAFKIKKVDQKIGSTGATLIPTDKEITPVRVNDQFVNKNKPKKGDFYILEDGCAPRVQDAKLFNKEFTEVKKKE